MGIFKRPLLYRWALLLFLGYSSSLFVSRNTHTGAYPNCCRVGKHVDQDMSQHLNQFYG